MNPHDAWLRTWSALGAVPEPGLDLELITCWSEPHRHYHTLQHLQECLHTFEPLRPLARQPAEIELALWFHDAIYDPTQDDNEQRSADWAQVASLHAGLDPGVAARIRELVLATQHAAVPTDPDQELLVDVDLAILGAAPARFDEYEQQIRAEYAWVPLPFYRRARAELLTGFLARPRLYFSAPMFAERESLARANLARSLAALAP